MQAYSGASYFVLTGHVGGVEGLPNIHLQREGDLGMRLVRYELGGTTRFGVVEGERIVEMRGCIFDTPERTGEVDSMADARLLPPVIPSTFYAAGMNYMTHCRMHPELPVPQRADVGYRASNALIGPGDEVIIPKESPGKIQYEGELVVVIGKKAVTTPVK